MNSPATPSTATETLERARDDEARLHRALEAATRTPGAAADAATLQGAWLQARAWRLELEARLAAAPTTAPAEPASPVTATTEPAATTAGPTHARTPVHPEQSEGPQGESPQSKAPQGESPQEDGPQGAPPPADARRDAVAARMRQLVLDMKRHYVAVKREVALAIADERRLHRALETELAQVVRWEERTAVARRAGKPDLEREATDARAAYAERARAAQARWEHTRSAVEHLRDRLRTLHERVEQAEARAERFLGDQRLRRATLLTDAALALTERIAALQDDLDILLLDSNNPA